VKCRRSGLGQRLHVHIVVCSRQTASELATGLVKAGSPARGGLIFLLFADRNSSLGFFNFGV
jgi:hypothetical protein